MTINNASITENIVITRNFYEDGSELGKFIGWTLHIEDKQIDLFELMNECTEAWKTFITEDLFDSLEISKYLDNKQKKK
jgi:hypothetical protein